MSRDTIKNVNSLNLAALKDAAKKHQAAEKALVNATKKWNLAATKCAYALNIDDKPRYGDSVPNGVAFNCLHKHNKYTFCMHNYCPKIKR